MGKSYDKFLCSQSSIIISKDDAVHRCCWDLILHRIILVSHFSLISLLNLTRVSLPLLAFYLPLSYMTISLIRSLA